LWKKGLRYRPQNGVRNARKRLVSPTPQTPTRFQEYIKDLHEQGLEEKAEKAERMLLGN